MTSVKILVVEDESIVARDIADMLKKQGYDVPAIALSAEQAIQKTEQIQPDLVLMDIVLKGDVDGIEAAEQIRRRFDIPVLYLTAYTDEQTVKRAKITEPFGYITKPFDKRELYTNIEMALYKHKAEDNIRQIKESYDRLTDNADEAIFRVKAGGGYVTYLNAAAERIFGYSKAEWAEDPSLSFKIIHPDYKDKQKEFIKELNTTKKTIKNAVLKWIAKDDHEVIVEYTIVPIIDNSGKVIYFESIGRDITERKKAELELKLHSKIMTNMSEGVYLVRADDGIITYTNPKFEEIFGYDKGEMIGKHVSIVNAPTDKHPEETAWEIIEIMKKEGAWEGEIENIKKDGTRFWCFASVTMFDHPEYGRVLVAVHTDITEQKKTEEQIAKLAKFPAENPNPVLRISSRGTVVYANKASASLLEVWGCRVGQSLPHPWHELVLDALSSGQSQQTEVKCDGRIFSLTFAPVVDANYVNVYGHDITERKKAEQELAQALAWQEAIFEGSRDAVFVTGANSRFVIVNRAACELTGYSKQELLQMRIPDLHVEQDLTAYRLYHDRIMAGEEIVREAKKLRKDETKVDTEFNNRRITISGTTYMHTAARDITERKKAEEELIEHQAKLKAMAFEALRTEERERQRLAVGLHDSVCQKLVFTKLALESSLNLVSDSKVLASLRIACGAIGETIEQADSLTFELSNPVLRQLGFVIALEKYLTEEIRQKHGIEYELEGDEQLDTLQDEIKNCLFRVTRELLTNVVKHAQSRKVRVSVRESQGQIYVRVQDDGVGFKESQAGSKVSQTARFGLFSIREQLEYLGGHLEIESKPGRGTTATVVVPLRSKAVV